ncbi:DNA-binding transcriptional LysR family regulator [Kribbella orskensis]|uniref:DNA-binding transcriptional LysR family regulator n=1 Tax=Kribbella orskensis TaxID=2512216 RepID=A0ABY2BQ76_9ACTN|nr:MULTISPECIES: LysR family transcriptional regulator [Kribbella]TCN37304.1 DNA-binding transcriptional LysR family regulator [Kribbella sp. VKM Ac-2500]TCO27788.1 DNA-binding transcriptional LysR family regulator [Kribbella orskensis]
MDSRQLEYFVAVAEELSFTRAAQRLFTVQSTVSAAIRALEADLKTTLFDRSTRRVTLSDAGQALLPEAKAALEAIDRARAVVEEASTGLRGNVRIGTMTRLGLVDLAELLGAFYQRYPLVEVQVTTSPTGSSGLADDVRHGRLDVALVGLNRADLPGLETRELATVPFVVLVPSNHRLAGRGAIRLADLAGERFVDMLRGFGNRTTVDRAFDNAGLPRRVQVEVPDLTTVPDYVRAGLGVAVIPELDQDEAAGVTRLRITDTDLSWTLSAVTPSGRRPSRAVTALLDLMTAAIHPGSTYL